MCIPAIRSDNARVRLVQEGLPPIDAVVHEATPDFLVVRTSDGQYRFVDACADETFSPTPPLHHAARR
jgi:hypothetical protein